MYKTLIEDDENLPALFQPLDLDKPSSRRSLFKQAALGAVKAPIARAMVGQALQHAASQVVKQVTSPSAPVRPPLPSHISHPNAGKPGLVVPDKDLRAIGHNLFRQEHGSSERITPSDRQSLYQHAPSEAKRFDWKGKVGHDPEEATRKYHDAVVAGRTDYSHGGLDVNGFSHGPEITREHRSVLDQFNGQESGVRITTTDYTHPNFEGKLQKHTEYRLKKGFGGRVGEVSSRAWYHVKPGQNDPAPGTHEHYDASGVLKSDIPNPGRKIEMAPLEYVHREKNQKALRDAIPLLKDHYEDHGDVLSFTPENRAYESDKELPDWDYEKYPHPDEPGHNPKEYYSELEKRSKGVFIHENPFHWNNVKGNEMSPVDKRSMDAMHIDRHGKVTRFSVPLDMHERNAPSPSDASSKYGGLDWDHRNWLKKKVEDHFGRAGNGISFEHYKEALKSHGFPHGINRANSDNYFLPRDYEPSTRDFKEPQEHLKVEPTGKATKVTIHPGGRWETHVGKVSDTLQGPVPSMRKTGEGNTPVELQRHLRDLKRGPQNESVVYAITQIANGSSVDLMLRRLVG